MSETQSTKPKFDIIKVGSFEEFIINLNDYIKNNSFSSDILVLYRGQEDSRWK